MSASNSSNSALDGSGNPFTLGDVAESVSTHKVPKVYLGNPNDESLPNPAADGTDGTGITAPTGAVGIRGWLSGIYSKVAGSIAVTGTFWQATQPVSGTFWQATQPVSAASLPLPTGAAVESGGNLASILSAITSAIPAGSNATIIGSVGIDPTKNTIAIGSGQTSSALQVTVNPTITASSYTAGFVMGGIVTFASVLPANFVGKLMSINLLFKGSIQPGPYDLLLFSASPSNGTYANHAAPTWSASDMQYLLGVYTLDNPKNSLGTMTAYTIDNIGKLIVGASTSLYGILVQTNTSVNAPASTTDMSLMLGVSSWGL